MTELPKVNFGRSAFLITYQEKEEEMSILTKISFTCERKLFILAFIAFFLLLFMATNVYAIVKIAFDSDRDGNYEIYVMNADGTGQTNLTNYPANDGSPAWSQVENLIIDIKANGSVCLLP
jgi:hypothetical protein